MNVTARLSRDEINFLLEALDSHQSREATEHMAGMLIGAIMTPGKEEREKFVRAEDQKYKQTQEQRRALNEKIVIIKAKLLTMRDAATLEDAGIKP